MSNTLPFLQGLVKRAACTILSQPCPMPLCGVRLFREFSVFWGH